MCQARERFVFAVMITAAYAATMKEDTMIWSKERSDNWW